MALGAGPHEDLVKKHKAINITRKLTRRTHYTNFTFLPFSVLPMVTRVDLTLKTTLKGKWGLVREG
jgi:hypothetical protein